MAGEIQLSIRLNCRNGTTFDHKWEPNTFVFNQTTPYGSGGGQQLSGTTPATISFQSITGAGLSYFKNLSTDRTVQIGRASGTSFTSCFTLLPGEVLVGRPSVTNPSGIVTTTHTANIQYFMLDA
jgi:hypothetical protein